LVTGYSHLILQRSLRIIFSFSTPILSIPAPHPKIMAGPINFTIFTKSLPHTLRAISVLTFPPGFLLLFVSGITAHRVNPAIGIIPLFFSSAFSALLLANEKQCGCQSSGLAGTPIHLVFDLLLGVGLLVCLILTWVFLPRSWNGSDVMLGTYCTGFLGLNL
jgi:hypothetical protein